MANAEHYERLRQGVESWNDFRRATEVTPELDGADLSGLRLVDVDLQGAQLAGADLHGANLSLADLSGADLSGADLTKATLITTNGNGARLNRVRLRNATCDGLKLFDAGLDGADLRDTFMHQCDLQSARFRDADLRGTTFMMCQLVGADLTGARLDGKTSFVSSNLVGAKLVRVTAAGANLGSTNLLGADLTGANLAGADLTTASLVSATVTDADFSGARVYGLGAWNLAGKPRSESDLIITHGDEPVVTVDDLEVPQFIYLLRDNPKIQDLIETVTRKAVLILGRFTPQRKIVLDAIRERLKQENHVGILFDFDPAKGRTLTETVSALAHLSRFVIADLTAPKSVIQELDRIVPQLTSVPVQPIQHVDMESEGWAMFGDLKETGRVLPLYRYADVSQVERELREKILTPVAQWLERHGAARERDFALAEKERRLAERERLLAEREARLRQREQQLPPSGGS